jgi:hypothetical protein
MKYILIGALAIFISGCADDSTSSSQGSQPKPTVVATPAPTPTVPPGVFISDAKVTAAQVAKYYDLGCKTKGKPDAIKAIDPRLAAGNIFLEYMHLEDIGRVFALETEATFTAVTRSSSAADSIVKYSTYHPAFPGSVTETNCYVSSPAEGFCEGKMNTVISSFEIDRMIMPAAEPTTYEEGRYVLGKKVVPAWKEIKVTKGTFIDPTHPSIVRPAVKTETRVRLPTIPSQDVEFCGGAVGYKEIVWREEGGKPINSILIQLLDAR